MTAQEAYEKMVAGFTADPRFGYSGGACLYKADTGARCAVGHLIPDELVGIATHRGVSIRSLLSDLRHWRSGLGRELADEFSEADAERLYAILDDDERKVAFLEDAQRIHDDAAQGEFDPTAEATAVAGMVEQLHNLAQSAVLRRFADEIEHDQQGKLN